MFAIDDAYTVKNNLLMNVRGGFTRQLFPERRRSQGFDLSSLGFSNSLVSLDAAPSSRPSRTSTFDGYQNFSPWESGDGFFTTDVYNVTGSLVWLVGNHNLKFGTEYRRYVENSSRFPTAVSPTISFGNTWTRGPIDNSAGAPRGQDFASFLLGLPTGGSMSRAAEYTEQSGVFALYAHNDWRVRNNLTLNLGSAVGVREPAHRGRRSHDQRLRLRHAAADRRRGPGELRAQSDCRKCRCRRSRCAAACSIRTPAAPRRPGTAIYSNFMPRAGFSWQPQPKTAVRGGYGLFYDVLGPEPHQRQPDRLFARPPR